MAIGSGPLGAGPIAASAFGSSGATTFDEIIADGIGVLEALLDNSYSQETLSDTVSFTDIVAMIGTTFDETLAVTVSMVDNTTLGVLADMVLSDQVRFEVIPAAIRAQLAELAETLGAADSLTVFYGIVIVERLRVAPALLPNQISNITLVDAVRAVDALRFLLDLTLADTVGVSETLTAMRAVEIAETLGLQGVLAGAAKYQLTLSQTMQVTDSLLRFLGASADEVVAVSSALAAVGHFPGAITETVGVADQVAPLLLMALTVAEGVAVDDVDAVNMLFNPTLLDGVEVSAGYLAPDGNFTTWVMNARTGAVSEYLDYAFNSFARIDNKYVGASSSGLYELLGDTDDGTSIIARIKSGYMQFGGTRLSRLSAAYIAARGEGDFVLRIITGDGVTYNYSTTTRNMRNTKFHMGKGQRARYFAFELISAGQDFDLDTLEFVPVVVQRRV